MCWLKQKISNNITNRKKKDISIKYRQGKACFWWFSFWDNEKNKELLLSFIEKMSKDRTLFAITEYLADDAFLSNYAIDKASDLSNHKRMAFSIKNIDLSLMHSNFFQITDLSLEHLENFSLFFCDTILSFNDFLFSINSMANYRIGCIENSESSLKVWVSKPYFGYLEELVSQINISNKLL